MSSTVAAFSPLAYSLGSKKTRAGAKDFLFGKGSQTEQLPTMNPQQMQVLQQLLGQINPQSFNLQQQPTFQSGQNYLQQLLSGSPESTEAFEKPYRQQFEQQTVPGLAERFGGRGAQSSSAFQQALAKAGTDLHTGLASLREQLRLGALGPALQYGQAPGQMAGGLAQLGLGVSPFAYNFKPGNSGFLQQLLAGLAGGAAGGFGTLGGLAAGKSLFPSTFNSLMG